MNNNPGQPFQHHPLKLMGVFRSRGSIADWFHFGVSVDFRNTIFSVLLMDIPMRDPQTQHNLQCQDKRQDNRRDSRTRTQQHVAQCCSLCNVRPRLKFPLPHFDTGILPSGHRPCQNSRYCCSFDYRKVSPYSTAIAEHITSPAGL